MRDTLNEIWTTLSHNKLRTSLTGFAVAWGIFMLIALLGAGNGLLNAVNSNMDEVEETSMSIFPGNMTRPYGGLREGTPIKFDMKDVALLESKAFEGIVDEVSPVIYATETFSYGGEYVSANLNGATEAFRKIQKIKMMHGRFISKSDERNSAKVLVIGSRMAATLLGGDEEHPERLLGAYITGRNMMFRVVGIFYVDEGDNSNYCYAPFSLVKSMLGGSDRINRILLTFHGLYTEKQNADFEKRITRAIAGLHGADPEDTGVTYIWNRYTSSIETKKASNYINIALWILGIFTLMSGIVGVSNIMLISVKERTHEFGIRKAIGAKPWGILKLIIGESVGITAFFGYIGMIFGLIACFVMDKTLASTPTDVGFAKIYIFKDPTVGIDVALEATLLLIIAGTVAGLIPARKAAKVKPIEALRDE